jgi:HAD superfamily hydrolase (TIGR01509 family)
MKKTYGLIFDVDGVIADTEEVNARASIKVFSDLFGVHNVQRKDFEAGLGRGAEEYIKAAARVHNLKLTDKQIITAVETRQENFLEILKDEPLRPFPGVIELMRAALSNDNFRLAIATSSTREKSETVLKSARIPYEKAVYVTGNDVKNKKPNPELFIIAAKRINVPPQNCLVIEDAPNGVQAARAAGCKCIAVTNSTSKEKLSQADLVIPSLAQVSLKDIIEMINYPYGQHIVL